MASAELKRILKPHGKIFISVKEGAGQRFVSDRAGQRWFSFYSEEELRKLLEEARFKIDSIEVVDEKILTGKKEQPPPPRWINVYAEKS